MEFSFLLALVLLVFVTIGSIDLDELVKRFWRKKELPPFVAKEEAQQSEEKSAPQFLSSTTRTVSVSVSTHISYFYGCSYDTFEGTFGTASFNPDRKSLRSDKGCK